MLKLKNDIKNDRQAIMSILPGFLLSFAIAIVSYLLNRFIFHSLGSATIAILLGIILGNLYFKQVSLVRKKTSGIFSDVFRGHSHFPNHW